MVYGGKMIFLGNVFKFFAVLALAASAGATYLMYSRVQNLEKVANSAMAIADGAITLPKIDDGLRTKLEAVVAVAGALPFVDKSGGLSSCDQGQVLSFSDNKIICVTINPQSGLTEVKTIAGAAGADGVAGQPGVAGANGTAGVDGLVGPAGAVGSSGVLSTILGNGLSGSLANQVLTLNIVTDLSGGLSNSGAGLSLLATCSANQLLKFSGSAWGCGNDNVGAVTTADLVSATPGITIVGGTGAVLGSGSSISIATADATHSGLLASLDWSIFNNKENSLTFAGNGLFARTGNNVATTTCATDEIMRYSGSAWVCSDSAGGAVGSAVAGGVSTGIMFVDSAGNLSNDVANFNYDSSTKKLTVTGGIDPLYFQASDISGGNAAYYEAKGGQNAAISSIGSGRIRYNAVTNHFEYSENGGGYAQLGGVAADSVDSSKIVNGTISAVDLADGLINSAKITDGTILFSDFAGNGCSGGNVIKFDGTNWVCAGDNVGSVNSGDLTTSNAAVTITGGTGAVLGTGTSIAIANASGTTSGLLTTSDWSMFNGKLAATRQITAGPGLVGGGDLSADRTLSLDIDGLTSLSGAIDGLDELAIYDASVGAVRKVTRDNFLAGITGALVYQGTYDANTNTPALTDGTGTKGNYYVLSGAGTQNYGSGAIVFNVGDWVLHNGTRWEKLINSVSVNSVFGRTGSIAAQTGDYSAAQISNAANGNISATTAQGALDELDSEKLGNGLADGMLWIGNNSGVATAIGLSGDATIANTGVLTIAANAINSAKILDGTITLADLAPDSVDDSKLVNGSVSLADMAANSINSSKIIDGTVAATDLADGSVTTIKIVDGNITDVKIADGAISASKLATNSVNGAKIVDGAITTADLADGAVATVKLADSSITSTKIADGTILFADIAANSCTSGQSMMFNGSAWACSALISGNLTSVNPAVTVNGGSGAVLGAGASITIANATTTADGLLTAADWNLFNNKAGAGRQIITGPGLIGGGDLTADRTLSLDINGLTVVSGSISNNDELAIYDVSTTSVKKISRADLLAGVTGALVYQGTYNAITNSPNLTDGTGTKGNYYVVDTAGGRDFGSGSITFNVGDWALHNGTRWEKLINSVSVASVFGRTGTVAAQNGDYTAAQISNVAAGNVSAITTQNAINELDTEKLDKTLTSGMLWLGSGSGVATAVALSGDVAVVNTGVMTIADSAITSAKIADSTIATTDLTDGAVTYAKLQNITGLKLLGNSAGTGAAASEVGLGSGLEFSGTNIKISAAVVSGIGALDSQAKDANGAFISANTLFLQTADATNSGLLSANAQTIAGAKTFTSGITAPIIGNTINGLVVNSGALSGVASVTGLGALTLAAGGTNQDVTIAPSGTGATILGNKVGIGTSTGLTNVLTVNGGLTLNDSTPTATTSALYSQGGLLYWNGSKVNTGPTTGATTSNIVFTVGDNNSSGHPWKAGTWTVPNTSGGFRLNMRIYGQGQYSSGMNSQEADVIMQINNDGSMGGQWYSIGNTNGGNAISAVSYKSIDSTTYDIWISGGQYFSSFVSVASSDGTFTPDGVTQSALPSGTTAFANQAYFNQNGAVTAFGGNVGIGTGSANPGASLDIVNAGTGLSFQAQGAIAYKKGSDYMLTGTQTNIDFGNASLIRLAGTSSLTIDTIAGGSDGKILTIINASSNPAYICDNTTATGIATNKIYTGTNSDIQLGNNASIMLIYDSGASRWRVIGGSGSGGTTIVTQTTSSALTVSAFSSTQKLDASAGAVVITLPSPSSNSGKSIEFVKVDNSVNFARIAPNASETIAGTNSVYLYGQNDAVTLRSDGTNWQIVSDNRQSVGQSKSYLKAALSANMSNVPSGTVVSFNTIPTNGQSGLAITLNATNGRFTLKAGKTYHLTSSLRAYGTQYADYTWSLVSGTALPSQSVGHSMLDTSTLGYASTPSDMVYTPTVDSVVNLVLVTAGNVNIDSTAAFAYIEEISTSQNVINTVDYFYGQATGNVTTASTDIPIVQSGGNIAASSPYITLTAGKTYELSASMYFRATYAEYGWYNASNALISNTAITGSLNSSDTTAITSADAIITPTTTMQVKLRTGGSVSGISAMNPNYSWITVRQLGSTSSTGVPMNSIIGAISSGALDNSSNPQTWNWSTATTQNAMTMTANALTSGALETLSTSSTAFTGKLLGLSSTGNNAAITGNLIDLDISGASSNAKGLNIANAGKGLSINVQGAVAYKAGGTYTAPGSANDVDLGNASLVRLDTSGIAQVLTGIANGTDGKILTIVNADTALDVTLAKDSASSAAANRIYTGTNSDLIISANASVNLVYDATSTHWRVVGGTGGGSATTFATQTSNAALAVTSYGTTQKLDASAGAVVITLPAPASNSGKSIEFVKTDNSVNTARVAPNATETIGGTNGVYLYGQNDAVTLRSDGTNWQIVSDNRSSIGQSKSYLRATRNSAQTVGIANGSPLIFNTSSESYGTDITLNSSTGIFTLKAGKTYRLTGSFNHVGSSAASGYVQSQWRNITGTALIGSMGGYSSQAASANDSTGGNISEAIITPLIDTNVQLEILNPINTSSLGWQLSGVWAYPWAYAEVISTPQNVTNTVDYLSATRSTTNQSISNNATDIVFNQKTSGNIAYDTSTGYATLAAGKTYLIKTNFNSWCSTTGYSTWRFADSATSLSLTSDPDFNIYCNGSVDELATKSIVYTPKTNQSIKFYFVAGPGNWVMGMTSQLEITQLGTTASTGLALNTIIGAINSGGLDNAGNSLTWDWSSATTQNAMSMNFNALTSGTGLSLASTSTAATGNLLGVTSASAGAFTNGGVRFNFTGLHTGNGVQIDDATVAGTALALNANAATTGTAESVSVNALTSGKGLSVTSSSTGLTGSLLNLAATGNNAAITGSLANISIGGASSNAVGLNIANAGQGLSMNVQGAIAIKKGNDYSVVNTTVDWSTGNASLIRLTGATAQTIDSIANGADGKMLTIINAASNEATIKDANTATTSVAANKILTGTGSDLTLSPDASLMMIYDSGSSRWRVVGGTGGNTSKIQTMTAAGNVTKWGYSAKVDTTTASFTATLPTAVNNTGKLIEVVKTDNSSNVVTISPFGAETINGSTNKIYLYNQSDSVVLRSDGTNSYIVADNRNSQSQSKSYINAGISTSFTPGTTATFAPWDVINSSYGSDIVTQTTGTNGNTDAAKGTITLKAGKTYKLAAGFSAIDGAGGTDSYIWQTVSGSTRTTIGTGGQGSTSEAGGVHAGGNVATVVYTPTSDTKVGLTVTGATAGNPTLNSGTTWLNVEVISTPQNVTNTVDYISARRSAALNLPASTSMDIPWDTKVNGNIPLNTSTGEFTLMAGKTYKLDAAVKFGGVETNNQGMYYVWTDGSGTQLPGQAAGQGRTVATTPDAYTNTSEAHLIYTPATNMVVKIRITSSNITDASNFDPATSYASITQLGTSAETLESVDYATATLTNAVSPAQTTNTIVPLTKSNGSIGLSGNAFTLKAGKTYMLKANMIGNTNGDVNGSMSYWWATTGGTDLVPNTRANTYVTTVTSALFSNGFTSTVYTPTVDTAVYLYTSMSSSSARNLTGAYAEITQLGTSAFTGLTLNALQAANASGAIDNLANVQTWNWSTLTTGTAMTYNASALTSGSALALINTGTMATGPMAIIQTGSNSGAEIGTHVTFKRPDGTVVGTIAQNAAGTIAYNTSSDQRLKENIKNTDYGVLDLMKINVSDFEYKNDPTDRKMNGFIAQELNKIYPDAVTVGTDEVDANGNLVNPWSVDYGRLTPLIIKSIQDQQAVNITAFAELAKKTNAITFNQDGDPIFNGGVYADKVIGLSNFVGNTSGIADQIAGLGVTTDSLKNSIDQLKAKELELESSNKTTELTTELVSVKEQIAKLTAEASKNSTSVLTADVISTLADAKALDIAGDLSIGGKLIVKGRMIYADSDAAGTATVVVGKDLVEIKYKKPFDKTPVLQVNAKKSGLDYEIIDESKDGFKIKLSKTVLVNTLFSWTTTAVE